MADRDEEDDVRSITKDLPSSVSFKTSVINEFKRSGVIGDDNKFHPHFTTPSGMMGLAKMSFNAWGDNPDYAQTFAEIASDYSKTAGIGLSAANIAKLSMFGSDALDWKGRLAHKGATLIGKAPKYIPGITDITQGYYIDSDGNKQPISNQGIEPTKIPGTDLSVNTNPLGLLNEQPASGPISVGGGQPFHHISGLLDVGKNLQGIKKSEDYEDLLGSKKNIFKVFGAVMNAIANRRAIPQVVEKVTEAIDDEDKLPPAIRIGGPS